MANYTMEDIEMLRKKSGISYAEAVALLDYHNGDAAQALIDLERQGKLSNPDAAQTAKSAGKKGMNLLQRLYRTRVKISKGETAVVNLSVLFILIAVLFSPHLAIIGLIASLLLGYHIAVDANDAAFEKENLEKMVRTAAENVKQSVTGIARDISQAVDQAGNAKSAKSAEPKRAEEPVKEVEAEEAPAAEPAGKDSFYTSSGYAEFMRTAGDLGADVPTLQVPVRVDSADGSVSYREENDGYSSVTVE